MQTLLSCSLIESVWVVFGFFWVVLTRFWVIMACSGSFWLVLGSYGSFWVVLDRFDSFHSLVKPIPIYIIYDDTNHLMTNLYTLHHYRHLGPKVGQKNVSKH